MRLLLKSAPREGYSVYAFSHGYSAGLSRSHLLETQDGLRDTDLPMRRNAPMHAALIVLTLVIGAERPAGTDGPAPLEPIPEIVSYPAEFTHGGWIPSPGPPGPGALYSRHRQKLPRPVGSCCRRSCVPNFQAEYFRQPYDYRRAFDYPWYISRR